MESNTDFLLQLNEVSEKHPDRMAIKLGEQEITYGELQRKTNCIARFIRENVSKKNQIIGIAIERSVETILSVIGVLKSGACYLPIDLGYPKDRIEYIIANSNLELILTKKELSENSFTNELDNGKLLYYEDIKFDKKSEQSISYDGISNSNAYVMYTSGSTGNPKGSLVSRSAINNLIQWQINQSHKNLDDNITLQLAPISFDVSFQEIFSTLCDGGKLILIQDMDRTDFEKIIKITEKEKISRVFMPPAFLNEIVDLGVENFNLSSLREVIVAGEQLKISNRVKNFFRNLKKCKLINQYGPSETHVVSSYQLGENIDNWQELPPIGYAIDNVQLYVLDKSLREKKVGNWGELYIGGACISDGYLNNVEETQKRYINYKNIGGVIYKTGDIVRKNANGLLEYKGRNDNQVKIRGFRIELQEIESKLLQHKEVKDCTVIVTKGKYEDKILVAYVIRYKISENEAEEQEFKKEYHDYLKKLLPEYMIPKKIIILDKFPLTPNGKVDKKKLFELSIYHLETIENNTSMEKGVKEILLEIWRDVLETKFVDYNSNFFDLGGNSILVSILIKKINDYFSLKIPIVEMYKNPTIHKMATFIELELFNHEENSKCLNINIVESTNNSFDNQDIAIIGMACRFPDSKTPDEFWQNLISNKDLIKHFNNEKYSGEQENDYVYAGGFLDNIEYFDAEFFGISNKEAKLMDPQHRVFLECVWESFENAGYNPYEIKDRVGVFAGTGASSYLVNNVFLNMHTPVNLLSSAENMQVLYTNDKDFISTRVSYLLNLTGPSINVQSACSTSLVSVHLACQSLRNSECEMAIAGASTIIIPQKTGYKYSQDMFFSHDGECRAFDEKSTGTVFSDGVGVVLLKPLAKAIKDNDFIYAVIKSSAINNDGSDKIGFTAPSISGQRNVIQDAIKKANIEVQSIGYIETHGTGTIIGDQIEIKALTEAFNTNKKNFCALGSVKTNIGHTGWSSGIAGLIKVALALKNKQLPPLKNYEKPNPDLALEESPFYINKEVKYWEKVGFPRRAGLSAFGLGGTNSHIILEEADINPKVEGNIERSTHALAISGKTREAVKELLFKYHNEIDSILQNDIENICFTANTGRKHFDYRTIITFKGKSDLKEQLNILVNGADSAILGKENNAKSKIAFLFSGNGTQYENMGKELYDTNKYFREVMDYCNGIFFELTGISFLEIIYDNKNNKHLINDIIISQVAIFSLEIALTNFWGRLGIKPDFLIGHSLGEYTAACYAGVFSIEDCIKLLVARGELLKRLGNDLGMVSVRINIESLKEILILNKLELSIAANNTPELHVISGKNAEILKLCNILSERKIQFEKIQVGTAGHSKELEKYLPEFRKTLLQIKLNNPKTKIISTLNGELLGEDFSTIQYWCNHLVNTVQFEKGIKKLLENKIDILVEIGPTPVLLGLAMECLPKYDALWLPSLRQNKSDWQQLIYSIEKLYLEGFAVNWNAIYYQRKRISLPTYPFQRGEYWISPPSNGIHNKNALTMIDDEWNKWFYNLVWDERNLEVSEKANNQINVEEEWLIFADNYEEVKSIIANTNLLDSKHYIILKGNCNQVTSDNIITIASEKEESYDFLLKAIEDKEYKILYLWNNSKHNLISNNGEIINIERIVWGSLDLINIIKKISERNLCKELWFISYPQSSENVCDATRDLENNITLAITRVIELENPSIKVKRLIFDSKSLQEINLKLSKEIKYNFSDDYVYYINNFRKTLRLKEHILTRNSKEFKLVKNGVYVITGGTGGIGSLITKWLADYGVKHIIILSRKDPKKEVLEEFSKLMKKGVKIEIKKLDVTDKKDVEKLFISLTKNKKNLTLKGIFHAAGVVEDSTINELNYEKIKKVFLPKILGSWNLHILSKKYFPGLDLFILFSSAAAVIGNGGQANHAAANAFMDSLVKLRKYEGLEAISINWGVWEQVGHLSDMEDTLLRLNRKGFKTISPQYGLKTLEYIIKEKLDNIAVIPMDWEKFISTNNLFDKSMYENLKSKYVKVGSVHNNIIQRVFNLKKDLRIDLINQYLTNLISEILGTKINSVSRETSFFELGMDSLSSIELRNKIQKDFKLNLPANFAYEYNSIDKVTERISELLDNFDYSIKGGYELSNELSTLEGEITKSSTQGDISCQQKRWLRLIELNYGERVVPIIFRSELNRDAFIKSLNSVINRHESLRWYFPNKRAKELSTEQVIELNNEIFIDVSYLPNKEKIEKINSIITNLFSNMPSPYVRTSWVIKCLNLDKDKFAILLGVQHLDFDGSSISVFAKEFKEYYFHYLFNKELNVTNEIVQYSDYIAWQKSYIEGEITADREFFKGLYTTVRKMTVLPSKSKSTPGKPLLAAKVCPPIMNGLWKKVGEASKKLGVSSFSILLGAYSILASELVGCSEVVIATIVNGRIDAKFKNTIGPFTAPFPIRLWVGDLSAREIVEQCNAEMVEINSRSHYPVGDLISTIPAFKNLPMETYFSDIGINFTNYKKKDEREKREFEILEILGSIAEEEFKIFNKIRFKRMPGLHLVINQLEQDLAFNFYYHVDRFSKVEVSKWADRYFEILHDIINKLK